jgi:hypothetical protein
MELTPFLTNIILGHDIDQFLLWKRQNKGSSLVFFAV